MSRIKRDKGLRKTYLLQASHWYGTPLNLWCWRSASGRILPLVKYFPVSAMGTKPPLSYEIWRSAIAEILVILFSQKNLKNIGETSPTHPGISLTAPPPLYALPYINQWVNIGCCFVLRALFLFFIDINGLCVIHSLVCLKLYLFVSKVDNTE